VARSPLGFGHLLGAVDYYTGEPLEIVVVGDAASPEVGEMLAEVRGRFLPNKVTLVAAEDEGPSISPLFEGKKSLNGATVYVCTRGVCKRPVTTRSDLAEELGRR
jgi:uncharacterized protein YyaL (SSP411 family)